MSKDPIVMKYDITEQQLLIYVRGENEAQRIFDQDWPDHYRIALQKLNHGKIFGLYRISVISYFILQVILTVIIKPLMSGIIKDDSLFSAQYPRPLSKCF